MPEKILIIAKYIFPNDTRLEQQVNNLLKNDISVDLLCIRLKDQLKKEKKENLTIYRIVDYNKISKDSFPVYLFKTFKFLFFVFFKMLFLSLYKKYKIIIVHTLPEFMVFVTILQRIAGVKIILDERDVTVELLSSRWTDKKLNFYYKLSTIVEKLTMRFCHHIIIASNGFKSSVMKRGIPANKITVIMNTADQNIFKFDQNRKFKKIKSHLNLIYHGTVSPRFGLLSAVKAMPIINNAIPDSVLNIYGIYDIGYRKEIQTFIQENYLEKHVILNEAIPLPQIYQLIKKMDMGVVPYISDHFMNLALSTKTFEYISSGLPVVASRLDSSKELFNENAIQYAKPGDIKDLAENIIKFAQNPEMQKSKVKEAYFQYHDYSSIENDKRFLDVIKPYI